MTTEFTLTRPDDWHLHLREGEIMELVVNQSAKWCARAMVMPNLASPVTSIERARTYRESIKSVLPTDSIFDPLMTLYLTPKTDPAVITAMSRLDWLLAVKYYPAGATTLSDAGVTSIDQCDSVFEKMTRLDVPLSIHGEVADTDVDIFDREKVFIERILVPLTRRYPDLRVIFEHVTTREAVQFVQSAEKNLAATITPHHMIINRNNILVGGITPHHYCLPVAKREEDRLALVEAAVSGDPRFFLGTDSAPHPQAAKISETGKAGIYSGYNALALYADVFDKRDRLDKLEAFASENGAAFYGLPKNKTTIKLTKKESLIPNRFSFGTDNLVPFMAGQSCGWTIEQT